MDNGKADIIAGIRELRAKAVEQLTGNEYYMIVQQLDSLATSAELSDEAARSVFTLISARLGASAPAVSAAGGPEVPETPSTPAQPDTPSTPEQPVIPDSPAQPDGSPGPEIPSPPISPAEPQTPPEASVAPAVAGSEEPVQIVTPSASSFGMPQATVALRFAEPVTPAEDAPAAKPVSGLADAVMATRRLIEERLSGNSYYSAANLLGQLQILPPTSGGGDMTRPDGFDGALTLLRREAAHLTGIAHDEAARIIATLENVLMPKPQPVAEPKPQPVAEKPAEAAAPQPAAPEAEAAASQSAVPEAEPVAEEAAAEPRTGFDDLADAAWKRVQQVSADDPRPAAALNGSAAPAPVVEEVAVPVVEPAPVAAAHDGSAAPAPVAEEAAPAVELAPVATAHNGSTAPAPVAEEMPPAVESTPVAAAQTEMMAQDIGEAFNDGGSESRSSEPCYLHEFELAGAQHGASDRQEPAAEAGADAASETQSQAAVSAEAEALIAPAEADAEPLAVVEDANVSAAVFEEVTEPQASREEETVPLGEPVAAEAELRVSELEQAAALPEQAMPLEELAIATAETAVSTAEPTVEVEPVVEKAEPIVAASEPVAAETEAAVAASPVIETVAEPAITAAASTIEDKAPVAEPAPAAQAASAAKPAKRGFFGRLFGGSSAENRR